MTTKKYLNITDYKRRTLRCLEKRGEQPIDWPIEVNDLLEIKKCPLCGSSSIAPITEVYLRSSLKFFSTATCQQCLFVFRPISPSLTWFKKCWQKIRSEDPKVFNPALEKDRQQRYRRYFNLIKTYKEGGRLLDVGAAYGIGTNLFKAKGFSVEAIEPEISRVDYLRKVLGISVVADTVEKLAARRKTYDVIIFAHCLEHLDSPDLAMSIVSRILKPNGLLYLEVPIMWDYVEWSDAFYMAHKSNFSLDNLQRFVRKRGLKIVKEIRYRRTDIGLILKLGQQEELTSKKNKTKTVDNVRRLYRKNWPLLHTPPLKQVLRYTVPNIEQFYQIIKLEKKKLIAPANISGFFSFETAV